MTLRPPRSFLKAERDDALAYEMAQEQAAALGRLGRALEAALAALARHDGAIAREPDSESPSPSASREREWLVQNASEALWCFVVQREASGLRDQRLIFREYGVPAEVRNRMGIVGGRGSVGDH
jgi:hypothetical protein